MLTYGQDKKRDEIVENYVRNEIYVCQSALLGELLGNMEGFSYDDVENLYLDPFTWTMEDCREWLDNYQVEHPDPDPWTMTEEELRDELLLDEDDESFSVDELRERLIAEMDSEITDGLDDWRDTVADNDDPAEPYEWWLVSPWLLDQLRKIGEVVLDNEYGMWWGRCCTGQSITLDHTMYEIAARVEREFGVHQ